MLATGGPTERATPLRPAQVWLWSTALLTAGALTAFILMGPPPSAAPDRGLVWLLFLGSSAHVASTAWLYTLPDVRSEARRRPARYLWAPVGLVGATGVVAAVLSPAQFTWLLLPFFAWQFFHFHKQNLGMTALAARSHQVAAPRSVERAALVCAGGAGIVGLMAHPRLLQLAVVPGVGGLFPVAAVAFVCAVGTGAVAMMRRPAPDRPLGFCAIYAISLLFSFPVFVFGSPYAAVGGMTVAHGLQYLLLVGLVASGAGPAAARWTRTALLVNVALLGGAVLSTTSHLHGSTMAGRLLFGCYLGAVMSHFVVDAGLWRMRDPFPRVFMADHVPFLVPPGAGGPGPLVADRSVTDIE